MFSLTFRNDTSRTWTACVYQELPHASRFETLAWLPVTAGPGEETRVTWTTALAVVLGRVAAASRRSLYVPLDRAETAAGTAWRIVRTAGTQKLERAGRAPLPDQVLVTNESGRAASPGIAVSGSPVTFVRELPGGATAQFLIRPSLFVGLFAGIRLGEILPASLIEPLPLKIGPLMTTITLHLREVGAKLVITVR